MLPLKINSIHYEVPNELTEITLRKFLELCRYEKKAPTKLQQIWMSKPEVAEEVRKSITPLEYYTQFIPYYAGWLSVLSGIPAEDLTAEETDPDGADAVEKLYNYFHRRFDRPTQGQSAQGGKIVHGGITYQLPHDFMIKSCTALYTTCGQLQDIAFKSEGNYAFALPKICAVLLNTKKGAYPSEEQQAKNAELFLDLTMDKAWKVDFFLHKRLQNFKAAFQIYTGMTAAE